MLVLAEKDLQELRTYTSPPAAVEAVLAAVCTALGVPSDWASALTLLNHSRVSVFSRIEAFDLASVRPARAAQLSRMLASPDLQPERVLAVSAAAHSLAAWVRAVHAHAQVDGIRARERSELRELLQQQDVRAVRSAPSNLGQAMCTAHTHLLLRSHPCINATQARPSRHYSTCWTCVQGQVQDKADSLASLNGHISELQEALQQASHDVARADASLRGEQAQVQLLDEAAQALRGQVGAINARLQALGAGVRNLLGDCVLAAAAVTYGGALPWHEQRRLLRRCGGVLAAVGLAHTEGFSLCGFMEATKRQHVLLPRNVLLDESMQASLYAVALVRTPVACSSACGTHSNELRKGASVS